ncbi:MAG: hypothetical protein WC607_03815 [Candidatus Micrarchaeia archaeon]
MCKYSLEEMKQKPLLETNAILISKFCHFLDGAKRELKYHNYYSLAVLIRSMNEIFYALSFFYKKPEKIKDWKNKKIKITIKEMIQTAYSKEKAEQTYNENYHFYSSAAHPKTNLIRLMGSVGYKERKGYNEVLILFEPKENKENEVMLRLDLLLSVSEIVNLEGIIFENKLEKNERTDIEKNIKKTKEIHGYYAKNRYWKQPGVQEIITTAKKERLKKLELEG